MQLCRLFIAFVALFGYLNFRSAVQDNITQNFPANDMAMLVGRIGLSIMLVMSIVLLGYPARRMMLILIRGNPDDSPPWLEAVVSAVVIGTSHSSFFYRLVLCFFFIRET